MSSPPAPPPGAAPAPAPGRTEGRVALYDWLRCGTVVLVVVHHAAMVFAQGTHRWLVTDPGAAWWVGPLLAAVGRWRMPLLFLVAGAMTVFMRRRVSARELLLERAGRLLPGTALSLLFLAPVQIYFVAHRGEPVPAFVRHAWTYVFAGDTPAWYHLWFVPELVCLTLAGVAADGLLGGRARVRLAAAARAVAGRPALVLAVGAGPVLVFLLPVRATAWLPPVLPGLDSARLLYHATYFAFGMAVAKLGLAPIAAPRVRRGALAGFAVCAAGSLGLAVAEHLGVGWRDFAVLGVHATTGHLAARSSGALGAWLGCVAVLGYGATYLRRSHPAVTYLRDATFPVYLLHQNVVVALGALMAPWDAPAPVKFALNAAATLLLCLALYELVLRRSGWARTLAGVHHRAADARCPWPAGLAEVWGGLRDRRSGRPARPARGVAHGTGLAAAAEPAAVTT